MASKTKTKQHSSGKKGSDALSSKRKSRLSQSDVPAYSIDDALRVPKAISDDYGKQPVSPLELAKALKMGPNTGPFRMITGAALAYGLTEGGAYAERISLTPLGRSIVAPTREGEDSESRREAVLRPRVIREFLIRYDGSKWPRNEIGRNVLEGLGTPAAHTDRALSMIHGNADATGLLTTINGVEYVHLKSDPSTIDKTDEVDSSDSPSDLAGQFVPPTGNGGQMTVSEPQEQESPSANRRVFVTHGKNRRIVDQIKKLLTFGDFEPVVAVENHTFAKPVPEKVLDEMRSCSAGIVHVGSEQRLLDSEGNEQQMLNPNVLVEIGAAMALYGRKFILLVEKGVALPSNLQGLYEVRFEGSALDHESTMSLLEAFNSFKSDSKI